MGGEFVLDVDADVDDATVVALFRRIAGCLNKLELIVLTFSGALFCFGDSFDVDDLLPILGKE